MSTFADLGLPEALIAVLSKQGIDEPFAIQAATLPDALAGHDVCGRAPTGSGKTLAFGLPLVAGLAAADGWSKPGRPQALILLPTRELAAQVTEVLTPLARAVGAHVAAVYGGVGYHPQKTALRKGVDLLIGCPGRLEDLIAQGDLDLSDVRWVVLDEADRMADMGFLPAVKRMLDQVSPARQMLLFSATLDGDVDVVIKRYLDKPRRHEVATDADDAGDVTHVWWKSTRERRLDLTVDLVRSHAPAIIFTRTRHGADRLTQRLEAAGLRAAPVHGARSQPQRDRALAAFVAGRVDALVATDVAARGIHVDAVASVIHYDPPGDSKDYTHRSGRTGRAGADGVVVSFVTPEVRRESASLQRALGMANATTEPDPAALPAAPARPAPKPLPPMRSGPAGAGRRRVGGHTGGGHNSTRHTGSSHTGSSHTSAAHTSAGRWDGPRTGTSRTATSRTGTSRTATARHAGDGAGRPAARGESRPDGAGATAGGFKRNGFRTQAAGRGGSQRPGR